MQPTQHSFPSSGTCYPAQHVSHARTPPPLWGLRVTFTGRKSLHQVSLVQSPHQLPYPWLKQAIVKEPRMHQLCFGIGDMEYCSFEPPHVLPLSAQGIRLPAPLLSNSYLSDLALWHFHPSLSFPVVESMKPSQNSFLLIPASSP